MGIFTYGIIRPTVWSLEKLGLSHRVIGSFRARQHRRTVAKNPFRDYVPTAHDVFVAAYVKSGTNWMMQIAHQLACHGHGNYEHIHSVVPWPDTAIMGPMRRYAIPVDDPSVWMASPERKRVIKTHYAISFSSRTMDCPLRFPSTPGSNCSSPSGWAQISRMKSSATSHGPAEAEHGC